MPARELAFADQNARASDHELRRVNLGLTRYEAIWRAMQEFTSSRGDSTIDEIWLTQHEAVYTLGLGGRVQHLRAATSIPVIKSDRGGQITFHGPGQLVAYLLLDLQRRGLGVRETVRRMEQAVIDVLADFAVAGERRLGAPGVYVGDAKIAALGLRIRRGCCYHGIALNVDMDLGPFAAIDPCGYPGLKVTQTIALGIAAGVEELGERLARQLKHRLDNG